MTRQQAVETVGEIAVLAVEAKPCDYSPRLAQGDRVEFTATVDINSGDWESVTAVYYQTQADLDTCDDGDLGSLTWTVDHYEAQ